jgi:UDPglucose--hexose-1-phosphate uridylyltransferase
VFDNRFPALTGNGRCEVVCYTSDHNSSFAQLSPERVSLLLEALIDQTTTLGALPGVEQVYCFENAGAEIGVTLQHPHGQIYAYPFVTPRTDRMIASVLGYRRRTGRNLFDDVVAGEITAGSRLVLRTARWTAFVPNAARWPYEIHLYPNDRVPDLAALDGEALSELPGVLLDLFGRFARLFDKPAPYIAGWHQAPVRQGRKDFALHLELFTLRRSNDKMKFLASSESGMDAFANDIIPEAAAARLRELGPSPG